MSMMLPRPLQFALTLVASVFMCNQTLPQAKAQEAGWVTLFDGKDLDQWDQVGQSNWHLAEGAVVADKMEGKEAGYLVSKKVYKDLVLRVEFWPSDDANSGIYFRCLDAKKITDRTCYEANIFDQRPDPSYGTGAITRYVEINQMPIGCADLIPLFEVFAVEERDPAGFLSLILRQCLAHREIRDDECKNELQRTP